MEYKSFTIREAVDKLNRSLFLPALQREFVWTERQIVRLFDSVMRGYPISSLLFWQPRGSAATKWASYKFLEEAREGASHNSLANLSGARGAIFVLDGQQRLTALNIGLRGIYVSKEKRKWRNNPDAWKSKKLYLDVLHQNRRDEMGDDDQTDIQFRFTFWEEPPATSPSACWFEVGRILKCNSTRGLRRCIRSVLATLPRRSKRAVGAVRKSLTRLYHAIWRDPVVFYCTETLPDYERVLDIFVRANEAGTRLTKSDLLLSTITSNWKREDARKEIHQFVDYLNSGLDRPNDFQKDFVIKACFVLCDLPVKYKVTSFTRENLEKLETHWPKVKDALANCVRLVNRFGIDAENLTSVNALIPIAYYLFRQEGADLLGMSRWQVRNAAAIHRWLMMALLNRVFSGSSDTMLAGLREVLQRHGGKDKDFPVRQLNAAIEARGRSSVMGERLINRILETKYGDDEVFLALTLLYDDVFWGSIPHERDHIFPASGFNTEAFAESGVAVEDYERILMLKDQLANLQLLTERENREKQAKPFQKWLKTRDRSFRRKHLIPANRRNHSFKEFGRFIDNRKGLIRKRLMKLFAVE